MQANYLKTTIRRLLRHKSFSLINILGLSTGITACLLIYLYVNNELTYDAYNPKADRIARVTSVLHSPESDLPLATSPAVLATTLVRDYPEVEAAVRIQPTAIAVRKGGDVLAEEDFCYSEQPVFSLFAFSFIEGTAAAALTAPHSIVLTRSTAKKYFSWGPALGRTLICNGEDYKVTAVVEDRPANSDIPIAALLSKDYSKVTSWTDDDFECYTFVMFRGKMDLRRFSGQLAALDKYTRPEMEKAGAKDYRFLFGAEPLADVHFSKGKLKDTPKGNRQFDTVFSVLSVFILLIALLNYINLSTAKATERGKEVGVRKVIGARPGQLIRQFLTESSLLIVLAWLIAFGLVELSIPYFNRLLNTHLTLPVWTMLLFLFLLFPVTTVLAGSYPAFVLSRFRPIKVLKGGSGKEKKGASLRKVLTVVQFIITLVLLSGTVVLYHQMSFIKHKDLGVDRSQIATLPIPADSVSRAGATAFIEALRHEAGVRGVTVGSGMPAEGVEMYSTTGFSRGRKREFMCNYFNIDPLFLPMLHIRLAAGRNFSDSFPTDKKEGFIVNEALVAEMGWKSGVGESLESMGVKGKVVGVAKNFFYKSLHNVIEPMVMIYKIDPPLAVLVKTSAGEVPRLKELWKAHFPSQPFEYFFLDENFDRQYAKDRMTLVLFDLFTGLAICISCLGLYGLVSLITIQRTKEIGIRKVLGASIGQLVVLLSRDMLLLVGWAALIALPLAGVGAFRWLSSYAYHSAMNAWMFVLPVVFLLAVALTVTGFRIVRSALASPVKSLRE